MSWGLGFGLLPWGHCIGGGPDLDAPVISLQSPANGSVFVPNFAPVQFRLTEPTSKVDLGSVQVRIQQGNLSKIALANGLFQAPFASGSTIVANGSGFDVVIRPGTPWFQGASVTVYVEATDCYCNTLTASWSFTIAPCYGCVT
jgi:hypothetical protein